MLNYYYELKLVIIQNHTTLGTIIRDFESSHNIARAFRWFSIHSSLNKTVNWMSCHTTCKLSCILKINWSPTNHSREWQLECLLVYVPFHPIPFVKTFKFAMFGRVHMPLSWKLNRYSYRVLSGIDCTAVDHSEVSNFVECTITV